MGMRMQELAERSGLPRTTIHHYAREALLPPARKTAPNAAVYDEAHVERLRLITRLRGDEFGGLSIPEIRRVLRHLNAGFGLEASARLAKEGLDVEPEAGGQWTDAAGLTAATGLPRSFVEELKRSRLIGTGPSGHFDARDLLVAREAREVCEGRRIDPQDLAPLADLLREVGHYSETLVEVEEGRAGAVGREGTGGRTLRRDLAELCQLMLWRALAR